MTTLDLNAKLLSSAADKTNFQTTSDFPDELKARLSAAISEKEKRAGIQESICRRTKRLPSALTGKR